MSFLESQEQVPTHVETFCERPVFPGLLPVQGSRGDDQSPALGSLPVRKPRVASWSVVTLVNWISPSTQDHFQAHFCL